MQALFFALTLAAVGHQAPGDRIMKLVQDSFKAQRDGHYLKSVAILEEPYEKGSEDDKKQLGDLLSQQYAYIEDQDQASE